MFKKIYRHDEHVVYVINDKIIIIRHIKNKIKFYEPKLGMIRGLWQIRNIRFIISPHRQWKYFHWFIRLPGFYFEKNNSGVSIGTNNLYLWRVK